jgi:hypothetical protein
VDASDDNRDNSLSDYGFGALKWNPKATIEAMKECYVDEVEVSMFTDLSDLWCRGSRASRSKAGRQHTGARRHSSCRPHPAYGSSLMNQLKTTVAYVSVG